MAVFDDLVAEQDRLDAILGRLGEPEWAATMATIRLAELWARGLVITGPLGIAFPDTARLRHIAWLAYRTLPHALAHAGQQQCSVFCELTAPDGTDAWRYGPPDADSAITGPAGAFCRVAARRLAPGESGLVAVARTAPPQLACCAPYAE